MVEYATNRVIGHLKDFSDLANAIEGNSLEERMVRRFEKAWPIFPGMDYRVFSSYLH
jgi:predicted glycosyl hydrolase (DUF1957 family)